MQQPPWGSQGPGPSGMGGPSAQDQGNAPGQGWGQPPPGAQGQWGSGGQSPYGAPPQAGWNAGPSPVQEAEPEAEQSLDFGTPFKFIFSTPDSTTNLLMGSLFMMIPLIGPIALAGWQSEILQRLVKKHPKPIPKLDFSDFMYYVGRGITAFLAQILLGVPFQIVGVVMYFVMIAGMMTTGAMTRHGGSGGSGPLIAMLTIYGGFLGAIMLMMPLYGLFHHVLLTRAELSEEFGVTFSFGQLWDMIRRTWLTIIGASILAGIIGQFVMMAGMLMLCVGMFPAYVLLQAASTHLRYQIYKKFRARGGDAIAMKIPQPIPSEK